MGYAAKTISLASLEMDTINVIPLLPGGFELTEAVVTGKRKPRLSARKIVRRALEAIPINYPSAPFSLIGYYRDYQLKHGTYVNLNEGIVRIYDEGFDTVDSESSQLGLYELRENNDFARDSLAQRPYDYKNWTKIISKAYLHDYGGNELAILRIHNALRNYEVNAYDFVNQLKTDFIHNHNFRRGTNTQMADEGLYEIKFETIKAGYRAKGFLYISQNDYAIHRMDYALYDDTERNPENTVDRYGSNRKLIFEVMTEYRRRGQKMFLNYISFHNGFLIFVPSSFQRKETTVDLARQRLVVEFTNRPDRKESLKKGNYRISYKKNSLKIETLELQKNRIYITLEKKATKELFADLSRIGKKTVNMGTLDVQIEPFSDENGNILDDYKIENYDQFRELFIQRVMPGSTRDSGMMPMDMRKPIFDAQPVNSNDGSDYWMNTPLQGSFINENRP